MGAVKRTALARNISEASLSRWIKDEGLLNIPDGRGDYKKLGSGRKKKYPEIDYYYNKKDEEFYFKENLESNQKSRISDNQDVYRDE